MNALIQQFGNWLDHRTGLKGLVREALYENIPGGSRWRFISGSMLVFAFVTQMVTGVFLWMAYSPSSHTAWESVYYIQHEMTGGWLLRGIHHFMAQAMVVLLPLHLLQVIWDKAYRAPREINFWLGLILMLIVLALGLTGYLLPWDQKGYWATKVATNLMSLAPYGPEMQKLVVGGSDYGHHTLTRFFALHAGVLPALLVFFLVLHLALFRRHGITAHSTPKRPDQHFWPHQVLKDGIGCLILLAIVLLCTIHFDVRGLVTGNLPAEHQGAHLTAPADPTEEYSAARPEWYFLFLFQLLKKFQSEFFGAIVLPGLVVAFLFAMPLIGRWRAGHVLNVVLILALIAGAGYLTVEALYDDYYAQLHKDAAVDADDPAHSNRMQGSQNYLTAVEQGEREYARVLELIDYYGIPREGARALQHNDPETQGPRIFLRNCASCHSYLDEDGQGIRGPEPNEDGDPNGGPNLYGFASRSWLQGLLDPERIASHDYFGNTRHGQQDAGGDYPSGGMVEYVVDTLSDLDQQDQQLLEQLVAALSAEAGLPAQREADARARQDGTLEQGREALTGAFGCTDCHKFHDEGYLGAAPDLTGYGSYQWLRAFIADPQQERFYEDEANDRMPAFARHPELPEKNLLSEHELDMLVRWMREDDRDLARKLELARQVELAAEPAPAEPPQAEPQEAEAGPVEPESQGARLFRRHCARCHSHQDADGQGIAGPQPRPDGDPNGGPNLYGFASRSWLQGLLDPERIVGHHYFGNTAHGLQDADGDYKSGGMVEYVLDNLSDLSEEDQQVLEQVIVALSAEAGLPAQREADEQARQDGTLDQGREALADYFGCSDCHKFHDYGDLGYAPDLTGYGSADWLRGMIANPEGERFYIDNNDRMPAFAEHPEMPEMNQLTAEQLDDLVRFLRGQ